MSTFLIHDDTTLLLGSTYVLDNALVFDTAAVMQSVVQMDFSGTPYGGAPTWTDVTPYVITVGNPISITWGRQDEQSSVSPSQCSMMLDNADGRFTPGKTTGPYGTGVNVGVRVRVSVVINGSVYPRFDGYVDEWLGTYDNGGPYATVSVSASDILARMGTDTLATMLREDLVTIGGTSLAYYPLDEESGTRAAGEVTGNFPNASAVVVDSKFGAGTFSFGSSVDLPSVSSAVSMESTDTGSTTVSAKGTFLQVPNYLPSTGQWTMGMTFVGPETAPAALEQLLSLQTWALGTTWGVISLQLTTSGHVTFLVGGISATATATGTRLVCDGNAHQLALTLSADGTTVSLWVDGSMDSSYTSTGDIQWFQPGVGAGRQPMTLGLLYVRNRSVTSQYPFTGSMANFWYMAVAPTGTQIHGFAKSGATANAGELTSSRISRVLNYRPNTGASIQTGKQLVGEKDTKGETVLSVLLDIGKAEGTVVYVDGQGRVVFRSRANIYNQAPLLTLDASMAQVNADMSFRLDPQLLFNDVTFTAPNGSPQRVTNAASKASYGVRATSDDVMVDSDQSARDAAGWTLAQHKDAHVRSPALSVDLLCEPSVPVIAGVLALAPLSPVAISNLPSATSPSSTVTLIVQGATENIGLDSWQMSFYTSNVPPKTLRCDGTADAYTKLDAGLVIPW